MRAEEIQSVTIINTSSPDNFTVHSIRVNDDLFQNTFYALPDSTGKTVCKKCSQWYGGSKDQSLQTIGDTTVETSYIEHDEGACTDYEQFSESTIIQNIEEAYNDPALRVLINNVRVK